MRKLFIHFPLFRLLSPLATGTLVYLLILLINNNVDQLQDNFLGQELYVCIGLAFIIQEFARLALLFFERIELRIPEVVSLMIQMLISLCFSIVIVTVVMNYYFDSFLGYSPNLRELIIFNILFAFITIIYYLLYKGHELLFRINKVRLNFEESEMEKLTKDYKKYAAKINVDLLFESLEALIVVMKKDPEAAETLTDDVAALYRYNLRARTREIVKLSEEIEAVEILVKIYQSLPFRKVKFAYPNLRDEDAMIIPGALLFIIEKIIRTTIISRDDILAIVLSKEGEYFTLKYQSEEKLSEGLNMRMLDQIASRFAIYSDNFMTLNNVGNQIMIRIPKLQLDESNNH